MDRSIQTAVLGAVLLLTAIHSPSQVGGSLTGTITDPAGAAIAGAAITISNTATGQVFSTQSNQTGSYRFDLIPIGDYTVRASVAGFKSYSRDVSVGLSQSGPVNLALEVGSISENVEISSGGENIVSPTWNFWKEDASDVPTFVPIDSLRPHTPYLLVLDLAAFEYQNPFVGKRRTSSSLKQFLRDSPTSKLEALVLPDRNFFEPLPSSDRLIPFDVELKKFRSLQGRMIKTPDDVFVEYRKNPKLDYLFARVPVHVITTARTGQTAVAISIWNNGRPIDELSIPICVASQPTDCKESESVTALSLSGPAVFQDSGPAPDAALHFL